MFTTSGICVGVGAGEGSQGLQTPRSSSVERRLPLTSGSLCFQGAWWVFANLAPFPSESQGVGLHPI